MSKIRLGASAALTLATTLFVPQCEKGEERWTGTGGHHHHSSGHGHDHHESPAPGLKLLPKR